MSLKLVNKNYRYSTELKIQAIEMHQVGIPRLMIVKKLEIKDKKHVNIWIKQFNGQEIDAFVDRRRIQSKGWPKDPSPMSLDKEVEYLRAEVLY